jgi:hypothetical protein
MAAVPDFDPTAPSIARVYDYLLHGKDNFAVDREVAEKLMAVAPLTADVTRENRQFLARAAPPGSAAHVPPGPAAHVPPASAPHVPGVPKH